MDGFLPNFAILKSLSNWFLVAFSAIILAFLAHIICNRKDMNNG